MQERPSIPDSNIPSYLTNGCLKGKITLKILAASCQGSKIHATLFCLNACLPGSKPWRAELMGLTNPMLTLRFKIDPSGR